MLLLKHAVDLIQLAMPCILLNLAKQEVKMTNVNNHSAFPGQSVFTSPATQSRKDTACSNLTKVLRVVCLSSEEFEVTCSGLSNQHFIVFLSDQYYKDLTSLSIEKKELIEFSMVFLLQRLTTDSIRVAFDASLIRTHFPEFEPEVKAHCNRQARLRV